MSIDVGLGSGSVDFGAISVHIFPGLTSSEQIASWKVAGDEKQTRAARRREKPGFQKLLDRHDVCGVKTLAGINVAASFVGMFSACISISEVLRRTLSGPTFDSLGFQLWDLDPMVNPAPATGTPLTLRLLEDRG